MLFLLSSFLTHSVSARRRACALVRPFSSRILTRNDPSFPFRRRRTSLACRHPVPCLYRTFALQLPARRNCDIHILRHTAHKERVVRLRIKRSEVRRLSGVEAGLAKERTVSLTDDGDERRPATIPHTRARISISSELLATLQRRTSATPFSSFHPLLPLGHDDP